VLDKAANSVKGIASAALSKILSGDDTATGVEGSCSDNSDRHPTSSQDQPVASAVGIDRDGNGAVAPVDEVDSNGQPVRGARAGASWSSMEAGMEDGKDYLAALGNTDYNTNVDVGQGAKFGIDSLFLGNEKFNLGGVSDIADGSLRRYEFRKYENIVGDYFISPAFLDAVAVHMAKNFVWESLPGIRLPLILGIWGPKGCGKTFQTELAFKKLGVEAVVMSAGELEHEWAGTPGRMIRERYRKASEMSKVRGKMTALVINDIDAGVGHFKNTQTTVNNQIVVATLMNICDNPTRVAGAGNWREGDIIRRVPIIVTGNDFSTLFAPLIRDGRMAKFYWKPGRSELLDILTQMYKEDNVSESDLNTLLDTFPDQPLDFFGAIRAGTYDKQILEWIKDDVVKGDLTQDDANMAELSRRLVRKEGLPVFNTDHICLDVLIAEGNRIAEEQDNIGRVRLAGEYMNNIGANRGQALLGLQG